MQLKYPTIDGWLAYKRRLIQRDFDDLNLVTGREGKGKSKWARKIAKKLDPTFTVDRIHFDFDDYLDQIPSIERGQCIILDEARLHRRESMTKDRMTILDEFKENRGLGIHHFIVFNRFTKVDTDLVTDRVADWSYIRERGKVEIRQPITELSFDQYGRPQENTKYPLVAAFPFTDKEDPVQRAAYDAKKLARMKDRRARSRTDEPAAAPPRRTLPDGILDHAHAVWVDLAQGALKNGA